MQKRGRNIHQGLVETYGGLIKDIERNLKEGAVVEDCLAKTMLQSRETEGLDDLDMYILASAFMIGGVETVGSYPDKTRQSADFLRRQQLCSGSRP